MTKISKDFQDYDDDDPALQQRKNRWKYWDALKKIRVEYLENKTEFDAYQFEDYIQTKYGV